MAKALVLGGATGLLGQALVRVLEAREWKVDTLGRADGDVHDPIFLEKRVGDAEADVVFNTSAWTQVDDAEDHPGDARSMNFGLPQSLATIIRRLGGSHLVHFSTDFVFSGPHDCPWTEEDEPRPSCVYGQTKLDGEKAVLDILPESSAVVRTAWLFGAGRKNFVDTILAACKKRDSVSVVHDQTGSPTYTSDLALWSAQLAEGRATGLWHAANTGQASWCELASEAINLVACPCRVDPIMSDQWPQKAKRPEYSVLDSSKLATFLNTRIRPWPQALREHLFSTYDADIAGAAR